MANKLVELEDGIIVEVETREGEVRQISGGVFQRVNASLDTLSPILVTVSKAIANAWRGMTENVEVDKATIELGLSFEGEGNIFITKATTGANIVVTLELKAKSGKDKA